jgi:hypothetical protein
LLIIKLLSLNNRTPKLMKIMLNPIIKSVIPKVLSCPSILKTDIDQVNRDINGQDRMK